MTNAYNSAIGFILIKNVKLLTFLFIMQLDHFLPEISY